MFKHWAFVSARSPRSLMCHHPESVIYLFVLVVPRAMDVGLI